MTTDDAPMLSQPSDDNAPMISGRGTKIIADARGAYMAGNIYGLLELMDSEHQARFRSALVQQAIWNVQQHCDVSEADIAQRVLDAAEQWLTTRSSEHIDA